MCCSCRAAGGTHRTEGARFAHIAGRPYRMNHDALRSNVEFVLSEFFSEPYGSTGVEILPPAGVAALLPCRPNPFGRGTVIPYALPATGAVRITVHDIAGRRVRTLLSGVRQGGSREELWDGTDTFGEVVASGVYVIRLEAAGTVSTETVVRLR